MSFAFKANGGTAVSIVANQAFATLTTTTAGAVGDLAVLVYAMDNQAITDGDENAVTSVVTQDANIWIKAKEFTNGQAAIQAGATVGLWFCNLVKPISIGAVITLTIGNPPARDATALSLTYFSEASSMTAVVEATGSLAVDNNASAGSLNALTSNLACLRIRATATESNSATAWTKTAAFDGLFTQAVTNNGAAAVNQGIRAEYDISTGTGLASLPTGNINADHASIYVAWREVPTQFLTPSLYNDADAVFAPSEISYYFVSGGVVDIDEVFAEAVARATYTISDYSVFDDTDTLAVPDVFRGDVELGAVSIIDDDNVFDVVVIPNARYEIGIVEDEDIVHEPDVTSIWILVDEIHDDSDDLIGATVVSSSIVIHFGVISFDELVMPVVVSQTQAVSSGMDDKDNIFGSDALSETDAGPGYHGPDDQFFVSAFGTDDIVAPALFAADDAFRAPVVTGAGVAQGLQPSVHADNDIVRAPAVLRGTIVIMAPAHPNDDHFIPPFTGRRRSLLRSGHGIIKGTVDTVSLIGDRDRSKAA